MLRLFFLLTRIRTRLRVEMELSKKPETAFQITNLVEKRTKLAHSINHHQTLQDIYMPGAARFMRTSSETFSSLETVHAKTVPLLLPSKLPAELWTGGCLGDVEELELEMQKRQLGWALEDLRMQLAVKSRMLTGHSSHVQHQAAST